MEQHPIPQNIASYEFRLIGDMTLKQFGYLAGGVVVALIFYASPLPGYLRWPAIIFFSFLGFALAFLPIEERPLSQWILAFIRAVFSPTQFVWQKRPHKPEIFRATPKKPTHQKTPTVLPDQAQLSEYLKTLPQGVAKSSVDQQEEDFLKEIKNLFGQLQPKTTPQPPLSPAKPPLRPSVPPRPLPTKPPSTPPATKTKIAPFFEQKPKVRPLRPPALKPSQPPVPPKQPSPKPKKPAVRAKASPHLPIPAPPTTPNILVGMVLDQKGEMLEGAILEIRDSRGMPVRALKTNKLGQFRIATPLENGSYEIEIEKEGYQFDIIKIEAKGKPIPPIEIRAK